jgi:ABC-type lipoprotein release transport system permease subunit
MLKVFFWLRYLRKKRMILLSVAAVMLSTALLIVVASLFTGFIKTVEATGSQTFGDIYLNGWVSVEDHAQLIEKLQDISEVDSAAAILETYGLINLDIASGDVRGVRIIGVDAEQYCKVSGLDASLIEQGNGGQVSFGTGEKPGGFVGIGVLQQPDEKTDRYDIEAAKKLLGAEFILTTVSRASEGKYKPRYLKFRLADVLFTGMYIRDSKEIYLPMQEVARLLGKSGDSPTGNEVFHIKVKDGVAPAAVVDKVATVWRDFAKSAGFSTSVTENPFIATSNQMQASFIGELRKQMGLLLLIFGVVCSAGVLLIMCIFYMIAVTRQKDMALLKCCGATSGTVAWIFVGFGGCVGSAGALLGSILGYLIIRNINTLETWLTGALGFKLWKSSVYSFSRIPDLCNWQAVGWVALAAVAASALGAVIPAIVAARVKPVRILRYE